MATDLRRLACLVWLPALVLWAAASARASEALTSPPTLRLATAAAHPPRIDGRIEEACWRDAAQVTGFTLASRAQPAAEQTILYVTYDRSHLYVAFECLESRMDRLAAEIGERDGQVFKDDVVEVYLDPCRDRFTYYQFAVNPRGARFDLRGDAAGSDPRWDAPWDAAAARGEDRWWAEFAIPFSSLDIRLGRTGSTWGANFVRHEKPRGETSTWAPAGATPVRPDRFGALTGLDLDFSRYAYSVELADLGERLVGPNALKARVDGPFGGQVRVGLELFLPDGQVARTQTNVALTPGRPVWPVVLPYTLPREGNYRMVVRVRDPESGDTLHAVGASVAVPPLLELAVYPNHYRREVWLRPTVNVRQSDLKEFRLTARLLRNQTHVPPDQEVPFLVVKEPILRFNLAKSGPGDYEIQVTLAPKRSGAGLVRESVAFTMGALPNQRDPLVTITGDNVLMARGERLFPLGLYTPANLSDATLRQLRDAGFDLVRVPLQGTVAQMRTELDRVDACGARAWVPLGELLDLSTREEEKRRRLRAIVPALATHPALLCWESADEPAWAGRSADGLARGYRFLRTLDPDHPLWTNQAPRGTLRNLALFNRATDVAGADVYPVPEPQTQSDRFTRSIAVVGEETTRSVLSVLNRKPIFMVLQGFAWADLFEPADEPEAPIYPSFAQSRFMAYHAIVRGARGLLYWGTDYTPKPSPFWDDLRRLVFELSQMQPVLSGADAEGMVEVLAGAPRVETLVRRHPATRERFIFAVNASPQPVRARLRVPNAMPKVEWRVLFEQRKVMGNPITDGFGPYEVHVYTASTRFPEERTPRFLTMRR